MYKRLFMEIMAQIHQSLTKKSKLPYLYDKFQLIAKNQEGFNFFDFHIWYEAKFAELILWMVTTLATSQISLRKHSTNGYSYHVQSQ